MLLIFLRFILCPGLYEESHGIVSNSMWDPDYKEHFTKLNKDPKWWNGGEPIWVTAKLQNKHSATYFWAGSEVEIRGERPNFWMKYNISVPFESRVDQVMSWFTDHDINIVCLYFHEPDETGHTYGPNSPEIITKVVEMDTLLGYIIAEMKRYKLWDTVNLIVTSDHGMHESPSNQIITLSEIADIENLVEEIGDNGAISNLLPKENKTMEVSLNPSNDEVTFFQRTRALYH